MRQHPRVRLSGETTEVQHEVPWNLGRVISAVTNYNARKADNQWQANVADGYEYVVNTSFCAGFTKVFAIKNIWKNADSSAAT